MKRIIKFFRDAIRFKIFRLYSPSLGSNRKLYTFKNLWRRNTSEVYLKGPSHPNCRHTVEPFWVEKDSL